jgi:hypothetical protein
MELTFVTDLGQSFVVEIDPNMELENVMALLEAEVSWVVWLRSLSLHLGASPVSQPNNKASRILGGS